MMKRKRIILIALLCLGLCGCGSSAKEKESAALPTATDQIFSSSEEADTEVVSSSVFETVQKKGVIFSATEPEVMTYYDFQAQSIYPFCSDVNCAHKDENCNAWTDARTSAMFFINSKVWFLKENEEEQSLDWMVMDLDGTNRKVVAKLDPKKWKVENLYDSGRSWCIDGKVFANILCQPDEDGEQLNQVVQMDTKTGTVEKILPSRTEIVTMYKNYILYEEENPKTPKLTEEEFFKKNGPKADYEEYDAEWMRNSYRMKYSIYDLKTGKTKELCQLTDTPEMDESYLTDGGKFYMVSGKEIWCMDLVKGTWEKIYTGEEKLSIQCADDGKVFVLALNYSREKVLFYGYYDVKNSEMKKLNKNILGKGGWIFDHTDEYYVGSGKVHGKYGTVCVKKADYLKSDKNSVILMRKEKS